MDSIFIGYNVEDENKPIVERGIKSLLLTFDLNFPNFDHCCVEGSKLVYRRGDDPEDILLEYRCLLKTNNREVFEIRLRRVHDISEATVLDITRILVMSDDMSEIKEFVVYSLNPNEVDGDQMIEILQSLFPI